jgi:hypothetical protein
MMISSQDVIELKCSSGLRTMRVGTMPFVRLIEWDWKQEILLRLLLTETRFLSHSKEDCPWWAVLKPTMCESEGEERHIHWWTKMFLGLNSD